jgi:hypothetical protein
MEDITKVTHLIQRRNNHDFLASILYAVDEYISREMYYTLFRICFFMAGSVGCKAPVIILRYS